MSLDGEEGLSFEEPKPHPLKLHRTHNPAIEENLKSMAVNKKRLAQDLYYAGQSPLTRSIASLQHKPPVHQRLGTKGKLIRRPPRNMLNNGLTPNNKRLRLKRTNPGTTMPNGTVRPNVLRRPISVQQRLYRIRYNQQLESLVQAPQIRSKLFRNRRPDMVQPRPTNFTVQVDNTSFKTPPVSILTHSVRGSLNAQIQSEIQMIQSQNTFNPEIILSQPIFVPDYGYTSVFMNDRFSRLP